MTPGVLDLPPIWRGFDYPRLILKWKDNNGNPLDLTDYQCWAKTKDFDLGAVITQPLTGITQLSLNHMQTAGLTLMKYQWDWVFRNTVTGFIWPPLLSGMVEVKQAITNARLISGLNGSISGTTVSATVETGEPPGQNSVWYNWVPGGGIVAYLSLDDNPNRIDVYTGTAVNNLHQVAGSVSDPPALSFQPSAGITYRIRVSKANSAAPFILTWAFSV